MVGAALQVGLPLAIPLIRPLLTDEYNKVITSQERTPPLLMPLFIAEGVVLQEVDYCICKISFVAFIFFYKIYVFVVISFEHACHL